MSAAVGGGIEETTIDMLSESQMPLDCLKEILRELDKSILYKSLDLNSLQNVRRHILKHSEQSQTVVTTTIYSSLIEKLKLPEGISEILEHVNELVMSALIENLTPKPVSVSNSKVDGTEAKKTLPPQTPETGSERVSNPNTQKPSSHFLQWDNHPSISYQYKQANRHDSKSLLPFRTDQHLTLSTDHLSLGLDKQQECQNGLGTQKKAHSKSGTSLDEKSPPPNTEIVKKAETQSPKSDTTNQSKNQKQKQSLLPKKGAKGKLVLSEDPEAKPLRDKPN